MKLITTEQVSKYHPDKYSDQIADAILDACLQQDDKARVACEVMVKDNTVVLSGEISTTANIDYEDIVERVARKLRYNVDKVINLVGYQSREISEAVDRDELITAGDQGIMFGYASREVADSLEPFGLALANAIIKVIEEDVERKGSILRGDAKCQVTVDQDKVKLNNIVYYNGSPQLLTDYKGVRKILISACHNYGVGLEEVKSYITGLLDFAFPGLTSINEIEIVINPAGTWTIGGPTADCGLTGRKIVCDQYGPYSPVGGGAFSGKDPSKVDRSAAYMARYLAKYLLRITPTANECTVQLSYAIGEPSPFSVNVNSHNPELKDIEEEWIALINRNFDLTPQGIIKFLNLLNRNYEIISEGWHLRWL